MSKRNISFFIFMLLVGFAAVSAVLVVNGNVNFAFDDTEFSSGVIFSEVKTNDGIAVISSGEQNINFESKKLSTIGDTAVLDFVVGNKSRQYDANVTISCGVKGTSTSFNDYLEIKTDFVSPFELAAGENKPGKLTVKLVKAITESDVAVEVLCTLNATPKTRESVGNEWAQSFILNGADPVFNEETELVPVTIASNGEVKCANPDDGWYDYDNKEWANAVILVDTPSQEYNIGDVIKEEDIESYFVWIPRFRYQIFDKGEYTALESGSKPSESIAKEIKIVFEGKDTPVSTGTEVGEWRTHPAFTNYNTSGIWVGKFETGYKGDTSAAQAQVNIDDKSKVIIKPNVYSWRNITVYNSFKTSLNYLENMNSHMMRNTEWGAVAYLSHSKYGINDKVRINNNSNYLTGYASNVKDALGSATANSAYNTQTGYLASTTGNITGIYDMSGGAWEYMASYRKNSSKVAFTEEELVTYANHFDVYSENSGITSYNYRILGDATGEMGPFYNSTYYINNWHGDNSYFVDSDNPWFIRGGGYGTSSGAGQFDFDRYTGVPDNYEGFRIVLAFELGS